MTTSPWLSGAPEARVRYSDTVPWSGRRPLSSEASPPPRIASRTSRQKWQATRWPGAISSSSGTSVRERSSANGQRVWNRQPGGGLRGLGISPGGSSRRGRAADGGRAPRRPTGALRVRVGGRVEDPLRRPDLGELAEVHDGEPVGDVVDDVEVVCDDEVGEPEPLLRSFIRFRIWLPPRRRAPRSARRRRGTRVEARARARSRCGGPARPRARAGTSRQLGRELDHLQQLVDRIPLLARHVVDPVGLRQEVGDAQARVQARVRILEDHLHPPRSRRSSRGRRRETSLPSKRISPSVTASRRIAFPSVVFPDPDSPTRPSVSPRRISRSTPSTARTDRSWPQMRSNTPGARRTTYEDPVTDTSGVAARGHATPRLGIATDARVIPSRVVDSSARVRRRRASAARARCTWCWA